jgi:hypothetical protein
MRRAKVGEAEGVEKVAAKEARVELIHLANPVARVPRVRDERLPRLNLTCPSSEISCLFLRSALPKRVSESFHCA